MPIDFESELTDIELQAAGVLLGDAFADHDRRFLAMLSPEELAAHRHALWTLYQHVDRIWETPKKAGQHPEDMGGYGAVAGLRDLLGSMLHGTVDDVAGDRLDGLRVRTVVEQVD